ncbi:hypothetical protein JCM3765_004915 [Sporobolomyces pararoseus]
MPPDSPPLQSTLPINSSPPSPSPAPRSSRLNGASATSVSVNATSSSSYPPCFPRDDHVVPITSLPPSPRTPTRRSTPKTSTQGFEPITPSSVSSTSSPRSPNRRVQSTRTRNSGHSTSIDFNNDHSFSLEFGQELGRIQREGMNEREAQEREEEEPLMLPFNYQSIRETRIPHSLPAVKKRKQLRRLATMRWTVIVSTIAVSVMCWLSWKIVLRGEIEETGEKLLRDEMMNLISTRFEKKYNSTVDQAAVAFSGDEEGVEEEAFGEDGDLVKMENGEEFVYRNNFGGTFLKSNLFTSLNAKAQNDTPSLAEEWDYEMQTISGVNLGGWLTLEPFITPALFEPFLNSTTPSPAVDEYTLSQNLLHQGGEAHLFEVLDHHYRTFITEKDFAEIAGAGLNWVRIPLPFWSISKWSGEPFLERTSWKYFLKALEWSRKYGLRVNLDLHSVPGSQNGWNHSGKWGSINWLHSSMGYANAQRSLDYIETLAEFISRPEVAEVVKMFSLLNEPMMNVIGTEPLRSFYAKAYRVIRAQTGYNSGPIIAIHDGFKGTRRWFDFPATDQFRDFPALDENFHYSEQSYGVAKSPKKVRQRGGMDRVAIDSHRYLAFSEPDTRSVREQILKPCQKWAPEFNKTFNGFGIPIAGEFSIAPNDCGRFLNNVNQGTRLEGSFVNEVTGTPLFNASVSEGSCAFWEDYENWSPDFINDLRDLAYAQMDTFQNWFYWTWKTAPSLEQPRRFANPLWSYSLGVERGWIPRNPRQSQDFCYTYAEEHRLMAGMPRRRARKSQGEMEGWKIGHYTSEDQRILLKEANDDTTKYPWPPKYFYFDPMSAPSAFDLSKPKLEVSTLPRYSQTAKFVELPGPPSKALFHSSTSSRFWHEPILGCEYPDTWNSLNTTRWSEVCLSAS